MSYSHSLPANESNRSRDPRYRDRSRSEIRRVDDAETVTSSSLPVNQTVKQEQSTPTNGVLDFLKTLGLNSQLIQALINANPPKLEQVQQPPLLQQQSVNNAQEFASFLSQSYGLDSTTSVVTNQSVNRDPRRRQVSTVTNPIPSNHNAVANLAPKLIQPTDPQLISCSYPTVTTNPHNNSISIDELYKQYLSSIDQSLLDDETRKRFQRIALLDNELDKLHRMNIELTKSTERRSRRRTSTKDKDPLLKENENLQNELINYIKTLKTTLMLNASRYMFSSHAVIGR